MAVGGTGVPNALRSSHAESHLDRARAAATSGHSLDGRPSSEPHLAIAPLAFVGAPYASSAVFGFALIPPRGNDPLVDPVFQRAMRAIMPLSEAERDATERRRRLVLDRYSLAFALGDGSR